MKVRLNLLTTFWAAARKLPSRQQTKVLKFVHEYPDNPRSSGFNFEKIHAAASDKLRSIRLDQKYRIIAQQEKTNNTIICLHVDVHDAAYTWARTHRFEKNEHTGIYQIISASKTQPIRPPSPAEQDLFHAYRDRQLLRLGVPKEKLQLVRSFSTNNDLDEHIDALPEDTWIILNDLADGVSYDDLEREIAALAKKYTSDDELEHPENKRQFVTITDEDLQKMIDAPLSEWRIYLHPSQERIVKMRANGPIRVLGGAGTGKTVVAMHRARHLATEVFPEEDDRILFLVFNKNLAADISDNLRRMCAPDIFERIDINNVDSWVAQQANKFGLSGTITFQRPTLAKEAWKMALDREDDLLFSEHFIRDEFEAVVAAEGLQSITEYLRVSRRGRGSRLTRAARRQLWAIFEAYRNELEKLNIREPSDIRYQLANKLRESPPRYRSMVVDEAQDMSMATLRMIRAIVPEGPNDLLLAGDAHQRIYGRRVILSRCGINIRGRGRRLRINYRTPEKVRHWAVGFLEGMPYDDLNGGQDTVKGYTSLIQGEKPPTVQHYKTQHEEQAEVIEYVRKLANSEQLGNICLVAPYNHILDRYEGAFTASGLDVRRLGKSNDILALPGIRLATMHRVKGLEYDHMIVAGVNKNYLPAPYALRNAEDVVEENEIYRKARSLLYVACTRARKSLFISSFGERSELIDDVIHQRGKPPSF
ncbi:MAG: UvrD-helicase domain-containing protein [Bacteroidetes bacterium]|nr:UvrD-helicase domain-containing protein [Bacteroidota bacterium]